MGISYQNASEADRSEVERLVKIAVYGQVPGSSWVVEIEKLPTRIILMIVGDRLLTGHPVLRDAAQLLLQERLVGEQLAQHERMTDRLVETMKRLEEQGARLETSNLRLALYGLGVAIFGLVVAVIALFV